MKLEEGQIFSVRCNKCGAYTEDVIHYGDRYVFNCVYRHEGCESEGTYTRWIDGVDTGEPHWESLFMEMDEVDLGGVTPIEF